MKYKYKYVPEYEEIVISTITTANKNIQGFFMKSDQSYYNINRHDSAFMEDVTLLIDGTCIRIEDTVVDSDIFAGNTYNVQKYGSYGRCDCQLYCVLQEQIELYLKKINERSKHENKNFSSKNDQKKKIHIKDKSEEQSEYVKTSTPNINNDNTNTHNINNDNTNTHNINNDNTNTPNININNDNTNTPNININNDNTNTHNINNDNTNTHNINNDNTNTHNININNDNSKKSISYGDLRIRLIFNDFFGRSDLISIIDVLMNSLGVGEILVLPLSLAIAFSLGHKHASFIYPSGFSFVDDFVLADSFLLSGKRHCIIDDEDFVESFTKLKTQDESLRYSCSECEFRESTEDKVNSHISKEHTSGECFYYQESSEITQAFENRLSYVFGREKKLKIKTKKFSIWTDFVGAEKIEDPYSHAIRGAKLYSSLKCSEDCWMTKYEWCNFRLRALKEKLLFYI